jgi:hypothetical protein
MVVCLAPPRGDGTAGIGASLTVRATPGGVKQAMVRQFSQVVIWSDAINQYPVSAWWLYPNALTRFGSRR